MTDVLEKNTIISGSGIYGVAGFDFEMRDWLVVMADLAFGLVRSGSIETTENGATTEAAAFDVRMNRLRIGAYVRPFDSGSLNSFLVGLQYARRGLGISTTTGGTVVEYQNQFLASVIYEW